MKLSILVAILSLTLVSCSEKKPNVLMLYMDDLRPELGCYGEEHIQSPNIDALASSGVVFNNAYCNVAVCGASRASMLTGMHPNRHRFKSYNTFVQVDAPDAVTLPQLFKKNGYTTISNGKVYHHLDDQISDWDEIYRPYAFDKNPKGLAPTDWWESLWRDYMLPENARVYKETNRGPAFESANVHDTAYIDGLMTQKVIRDLEKLKSSDKPFFLTAGFISPHLPFNAPTHHWEKYKRDNVKQPDNNYIPKNAPLMSISLGAELRQYTDIPPMGEQVNDETAITLIHGYYATVSYVDYLIGNILNKLKELELDKNTIVVLVSDHGYNLQEHTQWCKWTSHRTSMQVPLIITSPFSKTVGATNALVELVDIYPTLAEMCDITLPANQLDGKSLVANVKDLSLVGKEHVFVKNQNGFTLQTQRYCYTEFINLENDELIASTLYDHEVDPDENVNVVDEEEYKSIVQQLHAILHKNYRDKIR